jgi:dnd system-associated protein 4
VESGSTSCLCGSLDAEDDRISAFEEYANGGLSILKDFFCDCLIDLDGLLAFIESQIKESAGSPDLDIMI